MKILSFSFLFFTCFFLASYCCFAQENQDDIVEKLKKGRQKREQMSLLENLLQADDLERLLHVMKNNPAKKKQILEILAKIIVLKKILEESIAEQMSDEDKNVVKGALTRAVS